MAERVGYDPETGLHSGNIPQVDDNSRTVMDGEFLFMSAWQNSCCTASLNLFKHRLELGVQSTLDWPWGLVWVLRG